MDIETILRLYKKAIHYEVSSRLRNHNDLWDDAIQETFIRIYRSLHSILRKEGRHQENYVRVIARNVARTHLYNREKELLRAASFDEWCSECEVSETDTGLQICEEMQICLNALNADEQDILLLRDVEQLTYAEIADAFGISETLCRKKVSRARKKLKKALTETTEGKAVIRGRYKEI